MDFPKHIMFPSDKTEIEFQGIITHDGRTKLKDVKGAYVYTVGKSKTGFYIAFSEDEIKSLLNRNIISIIQK